MQGYVTNIGQETKDNDNFCKVVIHATKEQAETEHGA